MDGGIDGRVGIYEGGGIRFLLFPGGKKVCKDDREWLSGVEGTLGPVSPVEAPL